MPEYFSIYRNSKINNYNNQNVKNLRKENSLELNLSLGSSKIDRDKMSLNNRINKYMPGRFISGSVNRWRIQAENLILNVTGWEADRINFSNDPLTPVQSRIEAFNVKGFQDSDDHYIVTSKRSRIVFDEKIRIPFIKKKTFKDEKVTNRWLIGLDDKDRDGFYLGYNIDQIDLNKKYTLYLQPQFLFHRLLNGGTNSYTKSEEPIYFSKSFTPITAADLFGLKASIKGEEFGWNIVLNADISSFDLTRFSHANRYWLSIDKKNKIPFLNDINSNIFAAYRYRAWNGSLGETDIYSAYGAFIDKTGKAKLNFTDISYLLRVGLGNYKAESFGGGDLLGRWRGSIYGSLNTGYPLWKVKHNNLPIHEKYRYSPVPISSSLYLNATIDSSYFVYQDGKYQQAIGFNIGPVLTLGNFSKNFLDYTKLKVAFGAKAKQGESPFNFDEIVDLATLSLGLTQQIYGPILLNSEFEFNIDGSSEYYGKLINSRLEAILQRRSYDLSLYYDPYRGLGGISIRLHDFNFDGTGVPFISKNNLDQTQSFL